MPGAVVVLKPGETLVTGDDYQEYTITLGNLANGTMKLYGTQYDTFKNLPGTSFSSSFSISNGQSITLKGNETFAISMTEHGSLYEFDFIKMNGSTIQEGIQQDFVHGPGGLPSNITITGAVKEKQT